MNNTRKILIVDDEENIRRIFKKALEKKNYIVHTASNAEDAICKIKTQKYFLVFSDIFMDGMSGLDLLKTVKEAAPLVKVVIMTAQDTMNNTIEAMRMGAYDYISKPFDFDAIYTLVEKTESNRGVQVPSKLEALLETKEYSIESIIGKSKKIQDILN